MLKEAFKLDLMLRNQSWQLIEKAQCAAMGTLALEEAPRLTNHWQNTLLQFYLPYEHVHGLIDVSAF